MLFCSCSKGWDPVFPNARIFNHILMCALNLLSFQPSYKFRTLWFHPLMWLLLYKLHCRVCTNLTWFSLWGHRDFLNSSNTKENWTRLPLSPLRNLSFRRADKAVSLLGISYFNQGGPSCLEVNKSTRRARRCTWKWTEAGFGRRVALN